jgi:multidrug efflux pump subunit AcrB
MVSKIDRSGVQKQQLYISVNDEKMRQYGFDIASMISVLKLQNVTGYTGELSLASNPVIPIHTNSFIKSDNISSDHLLKQINLGTQYFLLSKECNFKCSQNPHGKFLS